jgi:Trypsin
MGYTNEASLNSSVEIWANIKKFVHPNYVKDTHQNDIALLKLDVPLNLSGIFCIDYL